MSTARNRLVHGELTHQVIGAFHGVFNGLGSGLLEALYVNALSVRLRRMGVEVEREVPFRVVFDGVEIGHYRADLVCERTVLVEVKAGPQLPPNSVAQTLNYLRISGLPVALLLHFGPRPSFQRLVR